MARSPGRRPGGPGRGPTPAGPPRVAGATLRAAATEVAGLLTGPLAEAGFDVEDVAVRRAGSRAVLAVAVDCDGGLDLDALSRASRTASAVLDAADADHTLPAALVGAYTLEVGSRGTEAPLNAPRHFRRAVGRLLDVRCLDGTRVAGRLVAADDEPTGSFELAEEPGAPGTRVAYGDVARAVVELEMRRPEHPDDEDADEDDVDLLDDEDRDDDEPDDEDGFDDEPGQSGDAAEEETG